MEPVTSSLDGITTGFIGCDASQPRVIEGNVHFARTHPSWWCANVRIIIDKRTSCAYNLTVQSLAAEASVCP